MSLTNFTGDTSIISGLADEPSLTSAQLKAKFDEAGTSIKTFINGTLEPEIERLVAEEKITLQGLITALGNQLRNELLEDNKKRYHVGRIIMDTENVNPATYLGFGVWKLWGTGKVPVGVDANDTDFNEVEKTGGEKSKGLRALLGNIDNDISRIADVPTKATPYQREYDSRAYGSLNNFYTGHCSYNHSTLVTDGEGHEDISIIQPYITCYMWKRIS
jgi:hypothetical protein